MIRSCNSEERSDTLHDVSYSLTSTGYRDGGVSRFLDGGRRLSRHSGIRLREFRLSPSTIVGWIYGEDRERKKEKARKRGKGER